MPLVAVMITVNVCDGLPPLEEPPEVLPVVEPPVVDPPEPPVEPPLVVEPVVEPPVEPPVVVPAPPVVPPPVGPGAATPVVLPAELGCELPPPQATSHRAAPTMSSVRQRLCTVEERVKQDEGATQRPIIPRAAAAKVQPNAPNGASDAELALVVMVKVVFPGLSRLAGLKLQAAPMGNPEQESEIGAVRFCPEAVMANCAEDPAFTVAAEGSEKRDSDGVPDVIWPGFANCTIAVPVVSLAETYSAMPQALCPSGSAEMAAKSPQRWTEYVPEPA